MFCKILSVKKAVHCMVRYCNLTLQCSIIHISTGVLLVGADWLGCSGKYHSSFISIRHNFEMFPSLIDVLS